MSGPEPGAAPVNPSHDGAMESGDAGSGSGSGRNRRRRVRTPRSPRSGPAVDEVVPSGVSPTEPGDAGEGSGEPESSAVPLLVPRDGVPTPLTTSAEVADYAGRLAAGSGPVAVDAERASGYRYGQRAYLVQIRRRGAGTALIDPIAVPDLSPIQDAIADCEWILHAASQDLACLAGLGMAPKVLFDTELGARLAGFDRVGLGALVEELLGLRLEKGHSASDWSTRPLPRDWLIYAALDVEVLIELRDGVRQRLVETGKLAWAEAEFAAVLDTPEAAARVDPWRRTSGMHSLRSRRQLAALRALWEARDEVARRRDIAPGRILHDKAMVAGVLANPGSAEDLVALPVFRGRANRKLIGTWFGAIERARALTDDELPALTLPGNGPPPPNRWAEREPAAAARLVAAREVITELVQTHAVPAENLLSPDLVRRLAWDPPEPITEETVAMRLDAGRARPWQTALTAKSLATAMAASTPDAPAETDPDTVATV